MSDMRFKAAYPIFVSVLLTLTVLWQLPLKGLVPFPGDLLVGRFFPWNQQEWAGYPLGVPYKEFFAADTVRQTYPWRQLAIEQLKLGEVPWWNPYAFSGTPLLANLQSAPFYPLNLLYLLADFDFVWILQVLLQPILAIWFTYMFARSIKLSPLASMFAGLVFAFSGYMTAWLELNTVGHAALWLPLALFLINRGLVSPRYYLLLILPFSASLLAGHLQSSLYMLIIAGVYLVFWTKKEPFLSWTRAKHCLLPVLALAISVLIFLLQLLPALRLFPLTPRQGTNTQIFSQFLMPPSHLVTLIAPNFFGNPARQNYWGQDYVEFMAYFGLVPLILFLSGIFKPRRRSQRFFVLTSVTALFLVIKNPIAYLPLVTHFPILSSSAPSRALYVFQFAAAVVAAYALDELKLHTQRLARVFKLLIFLTGLLSFLMLFSWIFASDPVTKARLLVSLRNLAVPLAILTVVTLAYWLARKQPLLARGLPWIFFFITVLDLAYFTSGFLPFSRKEFMFPATPPFTYLQANAGNNRFFGDYTASVTSNLWLPYRVYSPEGYDSLYLKRYGQLMYASSQQGQLPASIPRSDADLPDNQDDTYRRRLQDLLGVKYLLHQIEFPESDYTPDLGRFPADRYQLVWQQDNYQIYQNLNALPRAFLVPNYYLASTDQEILDLLFDPEWDLTQTVILEARTQATLTDSLLVSGDDLLRQTENTIEVDRDDKPNKIEWIQAETVNSFTNPAGDRVEVKSYTPNRVIIDVQTQTPQFLLISDSYYPDWQAYLEPSGQKLSIYRANFSFRAVLLEPGNHTVVFTYKPGWLLGLDRK